MFVSDLRHFLDLPPDTPGPARRVAEQLTFIVRAGSAGDSGRWWVSALTCSRRPARRACPGRIAVLRTDIPPAIEWQCTSCGDDGVVSGWERSPFDLRSPGSARDARVPGGELCAVVPADVAATLRSLVLLDTATERLVFRAYEADDGIALLGHETSFDELIDAVASEANHEDNPRRRKRLDAAFGVLLAAVEDAPRP